jgi:predicted small integral membrane protein
MGAVVAVGSTTPPEGLVGTAAGVVGVALQAASKAPAAATPEIRRKSLREILLDIFSISYFFVFQFMINDMVCELGLDHKWGLI